MSVWLCRAGKYGEHEARFVEKNRIYYTFDTVRISLSSFSTRGDLQKYFLKAIPAVKENAAKVYAVQGYVFRREMAVGDWVVTPSKTTPGLLRFAEVTGEYEFDENAEEDYRHSRSVEWFAEMRREQFDADIQAALGALMTICKLKQEDRIKQTVHSFMNSKKCTNILPPPPRIWSFCHLIQFQTIS